MIENSPQTLAEIEKSTLRIAAIRMLDMAPVSLKRCIGRRTLSPRMSLEERAELEQDLEQSFVDEEAGRLIDAADAIAELRGKRSDQDEH